MNEIMDIMERFSVSRPIFRLTMNEYNDTIIMNVTNPVYQYVPTMLNPDDPVEKLVHEQYRETFNLKDYKFSFSKEDILNSVFLCIHKDIIDFIDKNLKMKKRGLSKLHIWFKLYNKNHNRRNMLMLYKYLHSKDFNKNAENSKNLMLILNAMREKYSAK